MSKKDLSERDICTKFITPAIQQAGWDIHAQVREEVSFTKGRIIVRGKLVTRGKAKRADYILYYKPNIPIAVIEAKDNNHAVGDGMQKALDYAATLDIPFVFSSNGDAFLFHDRIGQGGQIESELSLESFPTPAQLWSRYCGWKGLAPAEEAIVLQDYYEDVGGKEPRYYQSIAINRAIEAIAISTLRRQMEPYLRLDLAKVGTIEYGRREHRRIFQACVRKDPEAAGRHIVAHLQRTVRGFVEYIRRHTNHP